MPDLTRVRRYKGDDNMTHTRMITSLHIHQGETPKLVITRNTGERHGLTIITGTNEVQLWVNREQAQQLSDAFGTLFDAEDTQYVPTIDEADDIQSRVDAQTAHVLASKPIDPKLNAHLNGMAL